MTGEPRILVVCGLRREASLARGREVVTIAGGGDSGGLSSRLDELDATALRAVLSFGLAGALDPSLKVGAVIVTAGVQAYGPQASWPQASWPQASSRPGSGGSGPKSAAHVAAHVAATLRAGGFAVREADLVGVDAPVLSPAGKAGLRASSGAAAIDMESHHAAAFAARHSLPFMAVRVISDAADRALPAVAGSAMRTDGTIDVARVLAGIARNPRQLPSLLATARDAGIAFRVLGRVRGLLGPRLGFQL